MEPELLAFYDHQCGAARLSDAVEARTVMLNNLCATLYLSLDQPFLTSWHNHST
jgi:hypothetical protein